MLSRRPFQSAALVAVLCQVVIASQPHCLWPSLSGPCEFCERGWYGYNCESKCINCDTVGCHRQDGTCLQCTAGYYTSECTTPCPPHCRESYDGKIYCDRETGKCLENCRKRWWGDWCEKKCSDGCVDKACFFYDGSCIKGCVNGRRGERCDIVQCPVHCMSAVDGRENCHEKTSICAAGCESGWWGDRCEKTCHAHCNHTICNQYDGICSDGCEKGWAGDRCDIPCPSGCVRGVCTQYDNHVCTRGCKEGFYGDQCDEKCSTNCKDSECTYDHNLKSAVCTHGCVDGWWSHDCHRMCPKEYTTCHPQTGIGRPTILVDVKTENNDSKKLDLQSESLLIVLFITSCQLGWHIN